MFGSALKLIFGVIFFFLSTPSGMAHEAVLEEARAEVFVAQDFEDEDRQAVLSFEEAVLSLGGEISVETEESVGGSKQVKRNQKRSVSYARVFNKRLISSVYYARAATKGVARHPRTQDAQQERTAAIRYLQVASLDC